jgi:hypothetical protein
MAVAIVSDTMLACARRDMARPAGLGVPRMTSGVVDFLYATHDAGLFSLFGEPPK